MNKKHPWMRAFWMAVLGLLSVVPSAHARKIAAWSITNSAPATYATGIITTAGHTSETLTSLANINDVADLDEVWLFNHRNDNYTGYGATEQAAVELFVRNGGNLVFFDRRVVEASTVVPGAAAITFVRDIDGANASNPNLLNLDADAPAALVTGLTDASFDGGDYSSHGFATRSTLPPGGRTVLVRDENAEHSTGFVYAYHAGVVFYFPVPADYYLAGNGSPSIRTGLETLLTNFAGGALVGSVTTVGYTALYTKGEAVPGAGTDPKIQSGALWTGFGPPAINDAGKVAYVGKWKAPALVGPPKIAAQSGVGIFLDGTLIVKVGDAVPGISGTTFKSFKDPVVDNGGHVAFIAGIKGTGVVPASDTVVVSNGANGSLEVLAQEGSAAPGANGAVFKAFTSVSIKGQITAGTIFTAALLPDSGTPAATVANDTGAWWQPAAQSSVLKMVREGDAGFVSGETIKSFLVLKALGGSAGQGRGQRGGDGALIQLSLVGGTAPRQVEVLAQPNTLTEYAATGNTLGGSILSAATWKTLNLPSSGNFGANISVLGTLNANVGGVLSTTAKGIFLSADSGATWNPLVRTGDIAPDLGGVAIFSALKDPVNSSSGAGVAFAGTAKGGGLLATTNDAIWYKSASGTLLLVAREGNLPPSAPEGAKWKSFSSLALPGGATGPLFTAMLQKGVGALPGPGGIVAATDFALYGVASSGTLYELVREGQPLLTKTVKAFNVLKAVSGSAGVTRSFNANGKVVVLVTFTDATTAIVRVDVP